MLDHTDDTLRHLKWKKCPSCGWCCDKDGYNLIDKKEETVNGEEQPLVGHSFYNQQNDRKK